MKIKQEKSREKQEQKKRKPNIITTLKDEEFIYFETIFIIFFRSFYFFDNKINKLCDIPRDNYISPHINARFSQFYFNVRFFFFFNFLVSRSLCVYCTVYSLQSYFQANIKYKMYTCM